MQGIESWLARDADTGTPASKGFVQQRGAGFFTLCEPCNNRAGRLYVPEFRHWAGMGMNILFGPDGYARRFERETQPAYVSIDMQNRRPGAFVKQVVTMLLAMSPPSLGEIHPGLRAYARDPDLTGLPANLQFYLTLFAGPNGRYVGGAGSLRNVGTDLPIEEHYLFEVSAPPFSYVLSVDEATPAVDTCNITNFADVGVGQTAENVHMTLLLGYGPTPLPVDFRSPAALLADVVQTEAEMRASGDAA